MKIYNLKAMTLGFAIIGLMVTSMSDAATAIKNYPLSPQEPTQALKVKPESFYNLTMGYMGWTHHSSWFSMKLKKGKLYAITATADASAAGLHPGVACWYRPQGKGLVRVDFALDHFYSQFNSIIAPNQVNTDGDKERLGTIKMYFETNGYDGDGMEYPLGYQYQQGNVVGVLDGAPGKLEISFVAKNTGVYQCVVGGINPNPGVLNPNADYQVNVSVRGL